MTFIADYLSNTVGLGDILNEKAMILNVSEIVPATDVTVDVTYSMFYGRCYTFVSETKVTGGSIPVTHSLKF
jgi:hypothetical protein